jgi:threonine dehydrogenase-like Zn-dependent dehydrogenase
VPGIGQKNPHTGVEMPVVMGHEMSGTVTEVGSSVTTVAPGQQCAINPAVGRQTPWHGCVRGTSHWAAEFVQALGLLWPVRAGRRTVG